MIPYSRQSIEDDDIAAVTAVLRSDRLTQGPAVEEFEAALAAALGARHAVAFANGTVALHAATAATGIGSSDVVAVPALSFVASANCARYVGAAVRFVDIDPDTLNADPMTVPDVDALVAVHFAGLPMDLTCLARRPRVVIEDAAHALGALTPDGPVGNCARSDACVFSFHPVKAITTGEGGAVTTNDEGVAERLRRFRHHGIVPRTHSGPGHYDIPELGVNGRLTDFQAALGRSQLAKLDRFVARRNDLAARYRDSLTALPLELPPAAPRDSRHAYHLFAVQVDERDRVLAGLRAAGIGAQVHYPPIHRFGAYRDATPVALPHTERAATRLLSLPLFPDLSEAAQDVVISKVRELL